MSLPLANMTSVLKRGKSREAQDVNVTRRRPENDGSASPMSRVGEPSLKTAATTGASDFNRAGVSTRSVPGSRTCHEQRPRR